MARALPLVLAAAALLAAPAPAHAGHPVKAARARASAKDTTPPTIDHSPVTKHDGKGPLVVEAKIVDDKSGVFEPTLLVRAKGAMTFRRVPMTPKDGAPDVYTAQVPADLLEGDVEYLIEAFDKSGNGPARAGDEDHPLVIARDVPAPPPPPPPPPPDHPAPAATAPDDGGPSGVLLGTGIAVGAALLVGAVAGGGYLFYALRPAAPSVVTIQVKGPSPVPGGA